MYQLEEILDSNSELSFKMPNSKCYAEDSRIPQLLPLQQASGLGGLLNRLAKCLSRTIKKPKMLVVSRIS